MLPRCKGYACLGAARTAPCWCSVDASASCAPAVTGSTQTRQPPRLLASHLRVWREAAAPLLPGTCSLTSF
eukprot:6114830-Pleurochrysis_carterae.AAC.4